MNMSCLRTLSSLFALGRMWKQVRSPLGKIAGTKVKWLFDTLLSHGHLALRTTRNIQGLLSVTTTMHGGYAWPGPQLWLLVAVLVVGCLRFETPQAASFR